MGERHISEQKEYMGIRRGSSERHRGRYNTANTERKKELKHGSWEGERGRERETEDGREGGREKWRTGGRRRSLYKEIEANARNVNDTGIVKKTYDTDKL